MLQYDLLNITCKKVKKLTFKKVKKYYVKK